MAGYCCSMRLRDLLPAIALSLLASTALTVVRLQPEGDGPVLVYLGPAGAGRLQHDPALRGVALLDVPASGFALLRGDGEQIRSAFAFAIAWKGNASCMPPL